MNHFYPAFEASAWPTLPAPHSQFPFASWSKSRQNRLHIPHGVLEAANLEPVAEDLRIAVVGGCVLILRTELAWGAYDESARPARDGDGVSVSLWRMNTPLDADAVTIIGEGYLALIPSAQASRYSDLPALARHGSMLTEESIAKVDMPLPREKALGFKRYGVRTVPNKDSRFIDVSGRIWEAIGLKPGDAILVTRYQDGVRITKAQDGINDGVLVAKNVKDRATYATKRFGDAVLCSVKAKAARVAFTKDALLVLGDSIKLADFGLTAKYHIAGEIKVEEGEFVAPSTKRRVNYSIYPIRREEPRVQVQGEWLERFGFVPGARFTVEEHPLIRGRMLARLDEGGEHTVTLHRPGHDGGKLYIPTKLLAHFKSEDVKVWGTFEGLHVQQHFAGW